MLTHEGTLHFGVGAITGIEDTIAAEVMIAGDMSIGDTIVGDIIAGDTITGGIREGYMRGE